MVRFRDPQQSTSNYRHANLYSSAYRPEKVQSVAQSVAGHEVRERGEK